MIDLDENTKKLESLKNRLLIYPEHFWLLVKVCY